MEISLIWGIPVEATGGLKLALTGELAAAGLPVAVEWHRGACVDTLKYYTKTTSTLWRK